MAPALALRWLPWDRQWLELAGQGPGWLAVGWAACPPVASHVVCCEHAGLPHHVVASGSSLGSPGLQTSRES